MGEDNSEELKEFMYSLKSISPVDGRYHNSTKVLSDFFSEYALTKMRLHIEVEWFIHLADNVMFLPSKSSPERIILLYDWLRGLVNLTYLDLLQIKKIEKSVNHDVKSIELFLKEKIMKSEYEELKNIVQMAHFVCTSEDINNLAYALLIKDSMKSVIVPHLLEIINFLKDLSKKYHDETILSLTHGQPASPTTFGKEMSIFAHRISYIFENSLSRVQYLGKFNGAVGNFNAHVVAFNKIDWIQLTKSFIENKLNLKYKLYSTQIESHDFLAELFDSISRINVILIDLCCDMWLYISRDIIKVKSVSDCEVGSSTMPHKINPIHFENAEGNLGIANSLLKFFSMKLPISRLQRDLSDSTVIRNVGVAFSHTLVGMKSILKALTMISLNTHDHQESMMKNNWNLIAEPIQTILRKYNVPGSYEKIKDLTRGKECDEATIKKIIEDISHYISSEDLNNLNNLTPLNYIGLAKKLASDIDDYA